MDNFLSATCRSFRYCLAVVGGVMAALFISYGAFLRAEGDDEGLQDDLILAFGSFVAIMSCTIGCMASVGDRQVRKMVKAMEAERRRLAETVNTLTNEVTELGSLNDTYSEANELHRRLIKDAETRYKGRSKELKEQTEKLEGNVDNLQGEVSRLENTNRDLTFNVDRLGKLNQDYNIQLSRLREAHNLADEEIQQLKLLSSEGDARVKQLETLSSEQRSRIDNLSRQAANLNELQRKSVQMIQMLSLYGDDCKTMGMSLTEVSGKLRQTDNSLGLTATEMKTQITALQKVTQELSSVAAERGIHEDVEA